MFRVSEEDEIEGLDKSHHGGVAYDFLVKEDDDTSDDNTPPDFVDGELEPVTPVALEVDEEMIGTNSEVTAEA